MKIASFAVLLTLPLITLAEPGVRSGRLDNGMNVVLVENHSVPMIAANIVVKTGARNETWQTWGAAHFLEHLLFNGTKNHTQEEIYAAFDNIGAYHNAHTGSNFTDFMVLTASQDFQTGFDMLAEMVFESVLPEVKVEKERGIVIEEIARSKTSGGDGERSIDEVIFGQSPLSREVLGTTESIARLDRDSVLAFYHRWYQPNNSILFATGDFDADSLFDWFQDRLKRYPPTELPPRRVIERPDFAALAAMSPVITETSGKNRTVTLAMNAPRPGSEDYVPFQMTLRALDKRLESALTEGVRGGTDYSFDPDLAVLKISASCPKEGPSAKVLRQIISDQLNKLENSPPKEAEISRLAQTYLSEQIYNSERLHYYGMMYAQYWAVTSWEEFISWNNRMKAVTPAQIKEQAKWIAASDHFVMVTEPASEAVVDSAAKTMATYQIHNPGGAQIIVKHDPSARVFAVHVLARDRWKWDKTGTQGSVDLLHRTLGQAAAPGQKIGETFEKISATIKAADDPNIPYDDYYTAPEFSFVRFEVLPENWREGVEALAELLEKVPLTDQLVAASRQGAEMGKSGSGRNPAGLGVSKLRDRLVPGTSLAAGVYGDVKEVKLADLENLRRNYFHPENLIITVAGSVPAEEAANMVDRAFRSRAMQPIMRPDKFDAQERHLRNANLPTRDTLTLGRPQGAVVMGCMIREVTMQDRAALTIANAWFSDQMGMVLREQRGLAYSLGSSLSFQRGDKESLWGLWEISMGTRPEKLIEAETGIDELLNALTTHTFTLEEISRIRAVIAGRMLMRDMSRIGQAFAMGTGQLYWNDPESRAHLLDALNGLTPEEVTAAAQKFMKPGDLSRVIVK